MAQVRFRRGQRHLLLSHFRARLLQRLTGGAHLFVLRGNPLPQVPCAVIELDYLRAECVERRDIGIELLLQAGHFVQGPAPVGDGALGVGLAACNPLPKLLGLFLEPTDVGCNRGNPFRHRRHGAPSHRPASRPSASTPARASCNRLLPPP